MMKEGVRQSTCITHRHRRQCEGGQREGGRGSVEEGEGGGVMGTSVIVSTIKINTYFLKRKSMCL